MALTMSTPSRREHERDDGDVRRRLPDANEQLRRRARDTRRRRRCSRRSRADRGHEHRARRDVLGDLGERVEALRGDVDGRLDRGVDELGDDDERDREA